MRSVHIARRVVGGAAGFALAAGRPVGRIVVKRAGRTVVTRFGGPVVGAGAMYFFDPDRGHARRINTVAHARGVARRAFRRAARRTTAQEKQLFHRLEGTVATARGRGQFHPESEVDLREHLRQVIRTMHIPGAEVNVDVERGTASLRGQVETEDDRRRILDAVRPVDGVEQIEDFMHLPGAVAPNKAGVISGD
jgi:hypothetical protein